MKKENTSVERLAAFRIVVVYAILGGLWILCSDTALGWLSHDPGLITRIGIYKGLFFVSATAFLLYQLIVRYLLRVAKANRRVSESEERFRTLYDNMCETVLVMNPSTGKLVDVNRTMVSMFGYSREEALQLDILDLSCGEAPFSRKAALEQFSAAARGVPRLFEWRARKKDGMNFWVEVSMRTVQLIDGERLVVLVRDISERKQLATRLKITEFSVENMFDAVYWSTMDGRFFSVNAAACAMLGYCREELLQLSVPDIDPGFNREKLLATRQELYATGSRRFETVHRTRDGRSIPVEITSNYLSYDGHDYICSIVRDVTERLRTEKEVSFFRNLVEYTRDPIYVLSPSQGCRMVYANQAACSHFGVALDELQKKSIPDWDPDFDMKNIDPFWQELKQRKSLRFETRHRLASGELVPVEVTANYLEHGGEELTVGSFFDISERKKSEEALRTSEGHLRTLVQTLPDLIWLKNKDGVYLSCNPTFERFFGAKEADIVGKTDYDFVDRELAEFFVEHDRKAMVAGKPTSNEEWLTFAANGRRALFETVKTPMFDDSGTLIGVLGIGRDITARKRAEEELRENEARYRGLVELFPEAIYIHTGGKIVFANSQGARLVGAERPEDLYGREALDFVHPDYRDFVTNRINRSYEQGTPNSPAEEVFLRLDGLPVEVEVVSNAFTYHGEKALQIVARDISERKMRQEELLRAQKLESLGVLAGGIAHDFNNILTGIVGNLSIMRAEIPADHRLCDRLVLCEKAVQQATSLTCQLLTFAKGGEPVKKLFDLKTVIPETVAFVLRGSNVAHVLEIADDLWFLDADQGQISQVLNNLIINATQAMSAGGVVRVTASNCRLASEQVPPLKPGDYVQICVSDQGSGIPAEYLDKIFDPYFTTKETGSGLGLTTLYSIVRKHQGQVLVSSQIGHGTVFQIFLPATLEQPSQLCPAEGVTHPATVFENALVLVMDDELSIRDLTQEMLRLLGCRAESCASGEELIDCYRRRMSEGCKPDAVIMDLTIPGKMGGLEAAQRILELDCEARLIVSSGYSNDPVMANYRSFGFVDFLVKPYRFDDLSGALTRVL
ncbi:MAG: PAS domain S-box protein [Deltaproteobacteria bacterium]|nr:PAS domain S-box protein [Deltaproteobacteria bacterium]